MSKERLHIQTFALIQGCALNYRTGLVTRQGSPFTMLAKLHPELELKTDSRGTVRDRRKAILQIHEMLHQNYELPGTFLTLIEELQGAKA